MDNKRYPDRWGRHLVSTPFLYMMIIPLLVVDVFTTIYHAVCFPLWGLPYVNRKNYIRIDRHKLSYLSVGDKLNCLYCGYANGLLHYASAVAGETERYWCAIKHQAVEGFIPPAHHQDFIEYGDQAAFERITKESEASYQGTNLQDGIRQ